MLKTILVHMEGRTEVLEVVIIQGQGYAISLANSAEIADLNAQYREATAKLDWLKGSILNKYKVQLMSRPKSKSVAE